MFPFHSVCRYNTAFIKQKPEIKFMKIQHITDANFVRYA